jgi:hypothetical protein
MNETTKTRHAANCARVFGRYDATCPRCTELKNGAAARRGWGHRNQRHSDLDRTMRIQHDCKQSGCGPVCTFGDW